MDDASKMRICSSSNVALEQVGLSKVDSLERMRTRIEWE